MSRPQASPLVACVLAALLLPSLAHAVPWDGKPKILLHLSYPTTKGLECARGALTDCRGAVVNGDLYPDGNAYFLYVLVAMDPAYGPEIAGLQLSVDYNAAPHAGVDVYTWTYCADAHWEAPGVNGVWPAPLSNNIITWNRVENCQASETAVAGYFYLVAYTADVFRVVPRVIDNKVKVADCYSKEYVLSANDIGRVAFSSGAVTAGCNPCVENCTTSAPQGNPIARKQVPVLPVTWGRIKATFASDSGT